ILYNDTLHPEKRESFIKMPDGGYAIFEYFPAERRFREFHFKRISGSWMLYAYYAEELKLSKDFESFFEFIARFNTDESFLDSRIAQDAVYVHHEGEVLGSDEPVITE